MKPISNKFVHIDEFQDLSDTEIQFLDIYFKNSIFNYYGDFLQSINSKGEKEFKYEIKKFYINEKYRNAYEITNYVNKNLNLNMIPIGLTGYVEKIDYSDIINKNLCNSSDRVALIVKDLFEFKEAYEQYECYHYIENDNMNIKRDKINIIPLIYSKGLEFETVIVIENDMSRDELYVSYTRALNNLYIIK